MAFPLDAGHEGGAGEEPARGICDGGAFGPRRTRLSAGT